MGYTWATHESTHPSCVAGTHGHYMTLHVVHVWGDPITCTALRLTGLTARTLAGKCEARRLPRHYLALLVHLSSPLPPTHLMSYVSRVRPRHTLTSPPAIHSLALPTATCGSRVAPSCTLTLQAQRRLNRTRTPPGIQSTFKRRRCLQPHAHLGSPLLLAGLLPGPATPR